LIDLTHTSKVKGAWLYVSDELSELVEELEEAETKLKSLLIPFFRSVFSKFHQNRNVFVQAINCLAELDCLFSLSILAEDTSHGPMCKPVVHPYKKG